MNCIFFYVIFLTLILLAVIYYYNDNVVESFTTTNLTDNLFNDSHRLSDGNQIINDLNPTQSKTVLKQLYTKNMTEYIINQQVTSEQYYTFEAWYCDSNYRGKKYSIDIHYLLNSDTTKIKANLTVINSKLIGNEKWLYLQTVFQIPIKCQNIKLALGMPHIGNIRKIAGIHFYLTNPLIKNIPYNDKLSFYLSTNKIYCQSVNNNNQVWKDLTNNNNDFILNSTGKISSNNENGYNLKNIILHGPECSKLKLDPNHFTLGWKIKSNHQTSVIDGIFIKMFIATENDNNSILMISFISDLNNKYTKLIVNSLGHRYEWDIGLLNLETTFILVFDKDIFTLSLNGEIILDNKNHSRNKDKDLYESFLVEKTVTKDIFMNKKIIINPNKNLDIRLFNFFSYQTVIKTDEHSHIYQHFLNEKCICLPPVHTNLIHNSQVYKQLQINNNCKENCYLNCKTNIKKTVNKKTVNKKVSNGKNLNKQTDIHKVLYSINKANDNDKNTPCIYNYKLNSKGNLVKRKICRYPKTSANNIECSSDELPEAIA